MPEGAGSVTLLLHRSLCRCRPQRRAHGGIKLVLLKAQPAFPLLKAAAGTRAGAAASEFRPSPPDRRKPGLHPMQECRLEFDCKCTRRRGTRVGFASSGLSASYLTALLASVAMLPGTPQHIIQ